MENLNPEEKECIIQLGNATGYLQEELCYFYKNIPINWDNWRTGSKLLHFKDLVYFAHDYANKSLRMNEVELKNFLGFYHRVQAEEKAEAKQSEKEHREYYWQGKQIEFQAVIDFASLTIKLIMAVNAGAVIALLTFLQTIWSGEEYRKVIVIALIFFVYGLVSSIGVSLFAYFAQYAWHHENELVAQKYRKIAIFLGVSAMVSFAIGAVYIICKFLTM